MNNSTLSTVDGGGGRDPDADAKLVEALQRHESEATEWLVERFGDRVYRLAMRITGQNADAEEASRDSLCTAVDKIHMFDGKSAFSSWIDRITANAAYQKLRGRRSTSDEVVLDDVLPPLDAEAQHFEPMDDWSQRVDETNLRDDLRRVVAEAIDALSPDYRTALVLHDSEDVSNLDIAEAMSISLAEVTSRVHRSRLFVRKRLSEYLKSA